MSALVERRRPIVPNAVLATALFLFTEVMLFCGLISAFLVLRQQAPAWPPLGQPRLPILLTAVNTAILVGSGVTMWRTLGALARPKRLHQLLVATFGLGATFLVLQGFEWVRLVGHGLTTSSSLYGSFFYTIVGCHGLHVLGALLVLGWVVRNSDRYTPSTPDGLLAMRLYWMFVVGIWPVIYLLVYLW